MEFSYPFFQYIVSIKDNDFIYLFTSKKEVFIKLFQINLDNELLKLTIFYFLVSNASYRTIAEFFNTKPRVISKIAKKILKNNFKRREIFCYDTIGQFIHTGANYICYDEFLPRIFEYYPEIKLWCNSKKSIDGVVVIDAVIKYLLQYREELSLKKDEIEDLQLVMFDLTRNFDIDNFDSKTKNYLRIPRKDILLAIVGTLNNLRRVISYKTRSKVIVINYEVFADILNFSTIARKRMEKLIQLSSGIVNKKSLADYIFQLEKEIKPKNIDTEYFRSYNPLKIECLDGAKTIYRKN